MYAKTTCALVGALLSFAAAMPVNKRDLVWVTEIAEDIVTVPMTKTVWLEPGESTPTADSTWSMADAYGHGHYTKATSTVHSTVTVKPVQSSESSAAPSSTSSEVATTSPTIYSAPSATSSSESVAPISTSTSTYVAPSSTSAYVAPSTTSVYVAPSSTSVYVAPSSTSVYVAPTSTSVYVAPTPTSTYVAPTTSTSAAAQPAQSSSYSTGSSPMSGTSYSGDLTYYAPGLGACGITSGNDDKIVAISEITFDRFTPNGNPNNNPLCGKKVSIIGSSGSAYEATIVDRCVGCKAADLDLSPGFFQIVEPTGNGRVHNVDWSFI